MAKTPPDFTTHSASNDAVMSIDVTSKQMEGVVKTFASKMERLTKPLLRLSTAGAGGNASNALSGLSSKLISIGVVQVQLQKEMTMRLAQIQINTASKLQKDMMAKN